MGERTSYQPGTFCWVDLGTSDLEGATTFYGELFGWEAEEVEEGDGRYTLLRTHGRSVAGVYPKPEDSLPTVWLSYIAVEDVDAVAGRAGEQSGTVLAEPFTADRFGRGAVIADPTGAAVGLWQAGDLHGAELVNAPGALTWNELNTGDVERAATFYSELFGWSVDRIAEAQPPYWTVANGDRANGGMRELDKQAPGPFWLAYFAVEEVDAAAERVQELGGAVPVPPFRVPAGRFAVVADPQGAAFAVFEGQFDD